MNNNELSVTTQGMVEEWRRGMHDMQSTLDKVNDLLARLVGLEESRKYTEKSLEGLWVRHNILDDRVTLMDKTLTARVATVNVHAGHSTKMWGWIFPALLGFGGSLTGGLLLYLVTRS